MDRTRIQITLFHMFLLFPSLLPAQTGLVTGRVIDEITREPLPSANVQLIGTTIGGSTDLEGRFLLRGVPVGTYQLRASIIGYRQTVVNDIVVASGKPAQLEIALDQTPIGIGTVEVTASYFSRSPDATVSVQKLSAEEIRRSPGGFEDVLRAIAILPGVSQVEAGRNDLVVRGGAPSENLYCSRQH